MLRSAAKLVLPVLLLASCATTPSPSPGSSAETQSAALSTTSPLPSATGAAVGVPTPFPTPAPPPASGVTAWPQTIATDRDFAPVFAADGTGFYVTGGEDAQLVAFDRGGHTKPGWPIEEGPGADFGSPAVGRDGSAYVEECAGPRIGCVLHKFDHTGRDVSGWPVGIPTAFACSNEGRCMPNALDIGPDGTIFVSHWREAGGLQVLAIGASGSIKPGWPIASSTAGVYWNNQQVASDGTLVILSLPDGSETSASIAAFGPDGRSPTGWPVSVPDHSNYVLGPQGTVVIWSLIDDVGELCSNPRRTVFTVLDPDGRTLPGWPRGSTGYASAPVVDSEGTVYYVSATHKVYAHDRVGEVKADWPVGVPGAADGCDPESPHLAPDGTVVVVGDEVVALSPDGLSLPGWPYRPAGSLVGPCFDSECTGGHQAPAFGPDGTVYLVVYHGETGNVRAEVVAIDRRGQIKAGWPYRLPFDANTVSIAAVTVSPDGRVVVRSGGSSQFVLLALDADGRLAR